MLHVLLIEDSASDVLLIREGMRLSSVPADVFIAYDGEEGLRCLRQMHFDLVILDLNVPKLSGHQILEQYRTMSGPPVIVFTGSNNPADREKAMALGAKDYVVKPREFDKFMKAVRDMLERSNSAFA